KPRWGDGFYKIVERTHFKGLQSVLIVGRSKDDLRDIVQVFEELETAHSRHLHVEENYIGSELWNQLQSLFPGIRFSYDLDVRVCREEPLQLLPGYSFVVDNQSVHDVCGIRRVAATRPLELGVSCSVARSPYKMRSRSRALVSPIWVELESDSISTPSFSTAIRSEPLSREARIEISEPAGRPSTPCLIAFSTRVCSSMGGTGSSRAASSISICTRSLLSKRINSR